MVWIKQEDGGWPRWVCSHCGTMLVRAVDREPLPSRCNACGEYATDAAEGTSSVTASAVPPPSVREANNPLPKDEVSKHRIAVCNAPKNRRELVRAILVCQAKLADAIEYGRERKKRAMWIIKEATDERTVIQCSHCREYVAIKGFLEAPVDLADCPHCRSAMGGAVDGEESAGADDTGRS